MKTGMYLLLLWIGISLTALGQSAKKEETVSIKTSAVCGMCKDRIEQGLAFEKGIRSVTVDIKTKIASVGYNPLKTTADDIRKAISKLGYDADTVVADPKAYAKLPACCKKEQPPH